MLDIDKTFLLKHDSSQNASIKLIPHNSLCFLETQIIYDYTFPTFAFKTYLNLPILNHTRYIRLVDIKEYLRIKKGVLNINEDVAKHLNLCFFKCSEQQLTELFNLVQSFTSCHLYTSQSASCILIKLSDAKEIIKYYNCKYIPNKIPHALCQKKYKQCHVILTDFVNFKKNIVCNKDPEIAAELINIAKKPCLQDHLLPHKNLLGSNSVDFKRKGKIINIPCYVSTNQCKTYISLNHFKSNVLPHVNLNSIIQMCHLSKYKIKSHNMLSSIPNISNLNKDHQFITYRQAKKIFKKLDTMNHKSILRSQHVKLNSTKCLNHLNKKAFLKDMVDKSNHGETLPMLKFSCLQIEPNNSILSNNCHPVLEKDTPLHFEVNGIITFYNLCPLVTQTPTSNLIKQSGLIYMDLYQTRHSTCVLCSSCLKYYSICDFWYKHYLSHQPDYIKSYFKGRDSQIECTLYMTKSMKFGESTILTKNEAIKLNKLIDIRRSFKEPCFISKPLTTSISMTTLCINQYKDIVNKPVLDLENFSQVKDFYNFIEYEICDPCSINLYKVSHYMPHYLPHEVYSFVDKNVQLLMVPPPHSKSHNFKKFETIRDIMERHNLIVPISKVPLNYYLISSPFTSNVHNTLKVYSSWMNTLHF